MSDPPKPKPTETGKFITAELGAMLDSFAQGFHADIRRLGHTMKDHHGVSMHAHEQTRRNIVYLTRGYAELYREVKGEDPPPPPPEDDGTFMEALKPPRPRLPSHPESKPLVDLTKAVSENDSDIDEVKGRLLKVESQTSETRDQVGELLKLQKEQMGRPDKVEDRRTSFSKLVDGFLWALRDREGQKTVGAVGAFIFSTVTAIGTWYAIFTGRLPLPNTALPPAPTYQAPHMQP